MPLLFSLICTARFFIMKNVLFIINVILILLVGFLYFKVFSNKQATVPKSDTAATSEDSLKASIGRIAYIDLDSLQEHYTYYHKIKADFEKKQGSANNEIASLQKRFQNRTNQLQQQAATMTPDEQEKAMQEINKMQQDFHAKQEALDKELFEYNTRMKDDILNRIENFLTDYNKDGRYAYVFSYEPGFMFYKDSALNITRDVVNGLNAAYNASEKK